MGQKVICGGGDLQKVVSATISVVTKVSGVLAQTCSCWWASLLLDLLQVCKKQPVFGDCCLLEMLLGTDRGVAHFKGTVSFSGPGSVATAHSRGAVIYVRCHAPAFFW